MKSQPAAGKPSFLTRGGYLCILLMFLQLGLAACTPELKNRLWPNKGTPALSEQPSTPQTDPVAGTSAMEALREPGDAILLRGSRLVSGLPFLADNYQAVLFGEYLVADRNQNGELEHYPVQVWYSQEPVLLDERFAVGGCPQPSALSSQSMKDENWQVQVLGYRDYLIFISIPSRNSWPCIFVGQLAARIAYFRTYAPLISDLSLPSILRAGN